MVHWESYSLKLSGFNHRQVPNSRSITPKCTVSDEKWTVEYHNDFGTKKAPVKLMFIRSNDSWPTSLTGFWGNVLCKYYLGLNQDRLSLRAVRGFLVPSVIMKSKNRERFA